MTEIVEQNGKILQIQRAETYSELLHLNGTDLTKKNFELNVVPQKRKCTKCKRIVSAAEESPGLISIRCSKCMIRIAPRSNTIFAKSHLTWIKIMAILNLYSQKNDIQTIHQKTKISIVQVSTIVGNLSDIHVTKHSREIMRFSTRSFLSKCRTLYNIAAPNKIASPERKVNEVFEFHVIDYYTKNIVENEI
ncbi:unnamed protein product [Caenorhabditis angaria]|uniref:Uncharacterized protein n=1 Tax=Caenorhabditis angaria TaxID=860376 RepID=A0A9P1IEG2_9PELO|nr:unnamed protein product [Caenorhabditis angaria]